MHSKHPNSISSVTTSTPTSPPPPSPPPSPPHYLPPPPPLASPNTVPRCHHRYRSRSWCCRACGSAPLLLPVSILLLLSEECLCGVQYWQRGPPTHRRPHVQPERGEGGVSDQPWEPGVLCVQHRLLHTLLTGEIWEQTEEQEQGPSGQRGDHRNESDSAIDCSHLSISTLSNDMNFFFFSLLYFFSWVAGGQSKRR